MSTLSATVTVTPSLDNTERSYLPIAVTSVILLCIILVVLIITLLVLLLKKSKRRVVVIKPPEVANPHYNHFAILDDPSQTNIFKRLSLRIINRFSVVSSSHGDTLTRQPSNTLPSHTKNKPYTTSRRPSSTPILKYFTVVEEGLTTPEGREYEDTFSPTITIHKRDNPEVYEIPQLQGNIEVSESVTSRPYSQLCVPVYSDFCQNGFFVLTEDERRTRGSLSENFVQSGHCYSKLQFFEQCDNFWVPSSTTAGLYSQLSIKKYREIPHYQIEIDAKVGSGNFGAVFKGAWLTRERVLEVAVKVLKTDSNIVERIKFLQEAAIMGQFHHPNITRLHGVVTMEEPTMIVLELASKGDLLTYLRKLTPLPNPREQDPLQRLLLKFAREISSGMEHLSSKRFIHRDLAARNILLSNDLSCKIGDFGMARDLLDEDYYNSRGGKIPIKWTAPEALLYKKYSVDSDVWSYGILLYEIWSLGKDPFPEVTNSEMIGLAQTGICHHPAPGLSRAIYTLMVDCWNPDHSKRPTFSKICSYIDQSESILLHWSEMDLSISPLAHVLGVPLDEGKGLYKDLQGVYKQESKEF